MNDELPWSTAIFASWIEAWFAAEAARGVPFADSRRRFNEASPLLCALANAYGVARGSDLGVLDVMDYVVAREAEWWRAGARMKGPDA